MNKHKSSNKKYYTHTNKTKKKHVSLFHFNWGVFFSCLCSVVCCSSKNTWRDRKGKQYECCNRHWTIRIYENFPIFSSYLLLAAKCCLGRHTFLSQKVGRMQIFLFIWLFFILLFSEKFIVLLLHTMHVQIKMHHE